ncbi:MAG: sigma-70 family RNA polymerase sigma factor [Leptospirales bacterium]
MRSITIHIFSNIVSERWLNDYGDQLYAHAKSRLNNEEEILDVLQDTFVAALESVSRFRGDSSELTWLLGILRHKIFDVYRKRARKNTFTAEAVNVYEEFKEQDRYNVAIVDRAPGPDKIAENRELYFAIMNCIGKLPQMQTDAFTMRELDNLTTKDICNILSISTTNLNVILYRARINLQKCLHEKGINDVD